MAASPNDPRHFLYPLNRESEYVLVDDEGNEFPTSPEGLKESIDYDATSKWGLANCYLQIEDRDFVWAYFAKPDGIIFAVGRCSGEPFWEADPLWKKHALQIQWDRQLTKRLMKNPIRYDEFQQRVQVSATPANEGTVQFLDRWLDGNRPRGERKRDREVRIIKRMVQTRQGQQGFRDDLIRTYGARCFVTGCSELATLEAAHIRAVRKKGRHSVRNGMLLRADIHNLFDRGLFVIEEDYVVTLHPRIKKDPCYRDLDGKDLRAAAHGGPLPGLEALRFHRKSRSWD